MAKRRPQYSAEFRERAIRLVREQEETQGSQWAAIRSIAQKLGCSAESLRSWARRIEIDAGERPA